MKYRRTLVLAMGALALGFAALGWSSEFPCAAGKMGPVISDEEIESYRSRGPEGLQAFLDAYSEELTGSDPPGFVTQALDRICRQRDCRASRLYWHTDLDRALQAARDEGKAVLSLRLLGNLDDEYSCANSRFFRTVLYANRDVADRLRDRFVLHWQSVRPVPVAEIDMGDGRKLKRTLTGNSIHYVLGLDGFPVDALPGLYGPQAFLDWLNRVGNALRFDDNVSEASRNSLLKWYHGQRMQSIERVWEFELAQALGEESAGEDYWGAVVRLDAGGRKPFIDALSAGLVAITKAGPELPIIEILLESFVQLESRTDLEAWRALAEKYSDSARLDDGSKALIASKLDGTREQLDDTVRAFEGRIALDQVRNELTLHRQIHQWFFAGEVEDVESLNRRVYDELFLTPMEDEWLGLLPPNTYAALDHGGIQHRRP